MSTIDIIKVILGIALLLTGACITYRAGENDGLEQGERIGRDKQRADDIIELWKQMPDRDSRGRYKRKSARRLAA